MVARANEWDCYLPILLIILYLYLFKGAASQKSVLNIQTIKNITKLSETWKKPLKTVQDGINNTANTEKGTDDNLIAMWILKTCWPNGLEKFIFVVCNAWYDVWETYFFDTKLWFSHLQVISSLTLSSIASNRHRQYQQNEQDSRDRASLNIH